MTSGESRSVTELLVSWRAGDQAAADQLIVKVYDELRLLAARYLREERPGHTLDATALVHEMYLKLFAAEPVQWQSRAHFFAVAARQLRRILVSHARDRQAEKRGGKRLRITVSYLDAVAEPSGQDLMDLDEALNRLQQADERAAQVIELRFFAGLTETEIAEALQISVATLKRDWAFGRAWLLRQLGS